MLVTSMTPVVHGRIRGPRGTTLVERWSVSDRSPVASTAIPDLTCGTAALAPDGLTFACDDLKGTLHVIDVASSRVTLVKTKFVLLGADDHRWAADFEFSPDRRFLIALPYYDGEAVLWDAGGRKVMNSEAEIKRLSKLVFRAELLTFMARRQAGDCIGIEGPRVGRHRRRARCARPNRSAQGQGRRTSLFRRTQCRGSRGSAEHVFAKRAARLEMARAWFDGRTDKVSRTASADAISTIRAAGNSPSESSGRGTALRPSSMVGKWMQPDFSESLHL